jgi:hypothetical protein
VSQLQYNCIVAEKPFKKYIGKIPQETESEPIFLSILRVEGKTAYVQAKPEFLQINLFIFFPYAGDGIHSSEIFKKLF